MQYIIIICTVFFGELFWKDHVEKEIEKGSSKKALGGAVILTKYHNRGAFLDMGEKHPMVIRLLSVMLTVMASVVFIFSLGTMGNRLLKTGFSLFLGGAFSNTYDRLKQGYVIDYFRINIPIKAVRKVIFNLSDFYIIIGAALITAGK